MRIIIIIPKSNQCWGKRGKAGYHFKTMLSFPPKMNIIISVPYTSYLDWYKISTYA